MKSLTFCCCLYLILVSISLFSSAHANVRQHSHHIILSASKSLKNIQPSWGHEHPGFQFWTKHKSLVHKVSTLNGDSAPNPSACPAHPAPVTLPSPLPSTLSDALANLTSTLQEIMTNQMPQLSGMMASVTVDQSEIWSHGFGFATKDKPDVPPDQNTIFRIGSMSKIFPVLSLIQTVESGLIRSLDDEISDYLPGLSIQNPFDSLMSFPSWRSVASQLSGLPRETPCNYTLFCNSTTERVIDALKSSSLILPPYTRPSYSNLGFALLGRAQEYIISESVGKFISFEDIVTENILSPLDMKSTGFEFTPNVIDRMALAYDSSSGNQIPLYNLMWNAPAGQMYSSAADLSKLSSFFFRSKNYNDGSQLFDFSFVNEMMSPLYWNQDGTSGFSTPWELSFTNSYLARTKGGNVPGYNSIIALVPELKLSFVALTAGGSADETLLSSAALNVLIPALKEVYALLAPVAPLPPNPQLYTGNYVLLGQSTAVPVQLVNNNQLLFENVLMLNWIQGHQFRLQYLPKIINYIPCMVLEENALQDSVAEFILDPSTGVVKGFVVADDMLIFIKQ